MIDVFGTLGPSCDNEDILYEMFKEGMTGIRINLSHVKLADCAESITQIKTAAKRAAVEPKILIDMQGPELRIGNLEKPIELHQDDIIGLCAKNNEANTESETENRPSVAVPVDSIILENLRVGQEILLDDGKIAAQVISIDVENAPMSDFLVDVLAVPSARLKVTREGLLQGRKSIAIVGQTIEMPAITDTDRENIALAAKYGVTGVMQPFVRRVKELEELRKELDNNDGQQIRIYAKIENMDGVENLETFFPYADEIVIARGDLGNAMPLWELPKVQKMIAKTCKYSAMPFMVVTQMLASMEHSKVPTRAEVSDIYNAVLDGASSVMVTGETAVGENPVDVIKYLSKTAQVAM
ncbi:pyruvate kinase [Butyrivibrio sp. VCB2006]|uniref:pyruvate kinase n=1 Tax=Butyrivibrio sp. VCB2006 TaxID=1280679 RepID=UPI00040D334B|nr:pyruvate kinase [Butyrivibrio sp. VCB2006]